jgi:6-pyruvoyltetrahydropterin/6-carboxytetrahydropterin synthase
VFSVTRRYRFAASHRLHSPALSEAENQRVYGKCDHPYGHGHNYVLEVSAQGPLDPIAGSAVDIALLDRLVISQVLEPLEHRNLNTDVDWFGPAVPTSENLAIEICRRLRGNWGLVSSGEWPRLEKIRIEETPRNIFEIRADEVG